MQVYYCYVPVCNCKMNLQVHCRLTTPTCSQSRWFTTQLLVIGFRRSCNKDWFDDQETLKPVNYWTTCIGSTWRGSTTRTAVPRNLLVQLHAVPHRKDCAKWVLVVGDGGADPRRSRSTWHEVVLRWIRGSLWSQGHGQHLRPLAGWHDRLTVLNTFTWLSTNQPRSTL